MFAFFLVDITTDTPRAELFWNRAAARARLAELPGIAVNLRIRRAKIHLFNS